MSDNKNFELNDDDLDIVTGGTGFVNNLVQKGDAKKATKAVYKGQDAKVTKLVENGRLTNDGFMSGDVTDKGTFV